MKGGRCSVNGVIYQVSDTFLFNISDIHPGSEYYINYIYLKAQYTGQQGTVRISVEHNTSFPQQMYGSTQYSYVVLGQIYAVYDSGKQNYVPKIRSFDNGFPQMLLFGPYGEFT